MPGNKNNGAHDKGNKRRTQAEDQPPRDRLSQHLNRSVCLPFANQTGVVEAKQRASSAEGDASLSSSPLPSPAPYPVVVARSHSAIFEA